MLSRFTAQMAVRSEWSLEAPHFPAVLPCLALSSSLFPLRSSELVFRTRNRLRPPNLGLGDPGILPQPFQAASRGPLEPPHVVHVDTRGVRGLSTCLKPITDPRCLHPLRPVLQCTLVLHFLLIASLNNLEKRIPVYLTTLDGGHIRPSNCKNACPVHYTLSDSKSMHFESLVSHGPP